MVIFKVLPDGANTGKSLCPELEKDKVRLPPPPQPSFFTATVILYKKKKVLMMSTLTTSQMHPEYARACWSTPEHVGARQSMLEHAKARTISFIKFFL